MKTILEFKSVIFDSKKLPRYIPAGSSYNFFVEDGMSDNESVTKYEEKGIVKWLFAEHKARELIFNELGVNQNSFFKLEVTSPIIINQNKRPGDIDIFICEQQKPQQAIAIECKRVKVNVIDSDRNKVNKIDSIGDGIRQANALRDLGFYMTYLVILIEIDARNQTERNVFFRSLPQETFKRVYDFPLRDKLYQEVGIIFLEITQLTGKHINDMADISICIDKKANRLNQPANLTKRIIELLGHN